MPKTHRFVWPGALLATAVLATALPAAAMPAADGATLIGDTSATQTITATVVFKLRHEQQLARLISRSVTPGPHYHDFLSVEAFARRFAPPRGQLKQVGRYLADYGIRVDRLFDDNLAMTISGPAKALEQAFSVQLQNYAGPAAGHPAARYSRARFHRPNHAPHMPKALSQSGVLTVVGLSNQYQSQALHRVRPNAVPGAGLTAALPAGAMATHDPGHFTVGDVAAIYHINPLYDQGIDGAGKTIGIATYADFRISDVQTYWDMVGLTTKADRIARVRVDGGGEYGAAAGTGETSLDVEQSGGLAPQADMVVYDAPNSTAGGIHMFYRIVSDNRVDTLSYSWGLPEIFYLPQLNGGVDERDTLRAQNQAFMEAAAQGISVFAAAGDAGAYDTNRQLPAPDYSKTLSVDSPASSPYITAAGGTTRPVSLTGACPAGPAPTYDIQVPAVRAWAYDYLSDFYATCYGLDPVAAGIFSGGTGGGVSVFWPRPDYQDGLAGITVSAPDQVLVDRTVDPVETVLRLPAGFAGRNLPDISMNADPYSGYIVYSSPDGGLIAGYGGTSFVAPQLNGITALLAQAGDTRIGFMNPQIYRLQQAVNSPWQDIDNGDNWYWPARRGYDQATGVGTPDVAAWADALEAATHTDGHGPRR